MKKFINKALLLAVLTALFLTVSAAAADAIGSGVVTGDALRLRSEPSTSSSTITLLSKGTTLPVLEVLDGWYQVSWDDRTGYVSADYLAYTPAVQAVPVPDAEIPAAAVPGESALAGKTGLVTGDGINFRSGPSTDDAILGELNKDDALTIISVADGWCQVTWNGQEGYVSGTYVAVDGIPLKDPKGVITGNYVNVRSGPSTDAGILTKVSTGAAVELVSLADNWYAVRYDGMDGYICADYVKVYVPGAASSSGSDIVDTALSYLGVPYVYGGASPKGFDCSGFTMYVFGLFGYSLPHTATGQWNNCGTYVEKSDLQPGDLVLFCDPSASNGKACSHVGIYIGDNQFVHASSGSRRIQIDSLSLDYYSRYYVGAKRVG